MGKLYNRYNSIKKTLKPRSLETPTESKTHNNLNLEDIAKAKEIQSYLKYSKDDWPKILESWKLTFIFRQQCLKDAGAKCQQILDDWPLFKHSSMPALVNIIICFTNMYFNYIFLLFYFS